MTIFVVYEVIYISCMYVRSVNVYFHRCRALLRVFPAIELSQLQ